MLPFVVISCHMLSYEQICHLKILELKLSKVTPVNTKHLYNIYAMSAQRLQTLYECFTTALCLLGPHLDYVTRTTAAR